MYICEFLLYSLNFKRLTLITLMSRSTQLRSPHPDSPQEEVTLPPFVPA